MRLVNGQIQPALGSRADATDLFTLLDASRFRLLIFTGAHPDAQATERVKALLEVARPHAAYVQPLIVYGGQDASAFTELSPEVFIDPTLDLHFQYAAQKGAIYLVRPDLYVGYNAYGLEAELLESYFQTLFSTILAQPAPPTAIGVAKNGHGIHLPAFLVHH